MNQRRSGGRTLPKINNRTKKRSPERSKARASSTKKLSPDFVKIRNSYDKDDLMVDGVYNAVHEFLIQRGFLETVDVFQSEIVLQEKRPPRQNYDAILLDVF